MTALLAARGIDAPTKEQIGHARSEIKEKFTASQWLIDYFADKFLIGRDPGINVTDLERLADGYARRERRRLLREQ